MMNLRSIGWLGLALGLCGCGTDLSAPEGDLLISGGMIVDIENGSTTEAKDILVANGAIVEIADHREDRLPSGIEILDATGLYLLPGLIDVHAHIGDGGLNDNDDTDRRQALTQFLSYGVTSIFVPGGGR